MNTLSLYRTQLEIVESVWHSGGTLVPDEKLIADADIGDRIDELLTPIAASPTGSLEHIGYIPTLSNATFRDEEHVHVFCQEDDATYPVYQPAVLENYRELVQMQTKRQRTDASETKRASQSGAEAHDEAGEIVRFNELVRDLHSDPPQTSVERLIEDVVNMAVYFSRLVLHCKKLNSVRTDEGLERWEAEQQPLMRADLLRMDEQQTRGEWGLETRVEVHMGRTGEPRASGLVKLRVLSRRGEPFLVIVDWLCRATWASGPVGSELLEAVRRRWPACRVVLCTVRPADPAQYAQQPHEHDAAVGFYRKNGFEAAAPDVLAWLRDATAPADGGDLCSAWRDLQGLARAHLAHSLPVREEDARGERPIAWWEDRRGDQAARGARWARATAGTGRGWLAPGAAVEVLWGGEWWQARVVRVQGRAPGGVVVGYLDGAGDVVQVRARSPPSRLRVVARASACAARGARASARGDVGGRSGGGARARGA